MGLSSVNAIIERRERDGERDRGTETVCECGDRALGKVGVFLDLLTSGSELVEKTSFLGPGLSQTHLRPDLLRLWECKVRGVL